MSRSLPEFQKPPLVEVALSVQFDTLPELRTPQLGLMWNLFRQDFPIVEEHPPLESTIERFGVSSPPVPGFRFQMSNSPPTPRVWFLNQNRSELIQIQRDRFIHNWRKDSEGREYPRYESIRNKFQDELSKFKKQLAQEEIGTLVPNQCEITYVNQIITDDADPRAELHKILSFFQATESVGCPIEFEEATAELRYILRDTSGEKIGRLHVSAVPATGREDGRAMLVLTLTARGAPISKDTDGVLKFLDLGRETIVHMFASITTSKMHVTWGRIDA